MIDDRRREMKGDDREDERLKREEEKGRERIERKSDGRARKRKGE